MAEGHRHLPRPLSSVSLGELTQQRVLAFVQQWYGLGLAALFGLAASLIYVRSPDELRPIFDDSYISLTFATNIAEHAKLSFDGESWSTGATSPLHVLILAFFLKLGAAPFFASVAVGVGAHVALSTGTYLLAWSIFRSRLAALLGALAVAFTAFAALDSGNGLETSLFMALVAFTGASYFLTPSRRGRWLTGVLIALAVLTRPEGGFLLPAVAVYRWLDRGDDEPLTVYLGNAVALLLPGLVAGGAIALYSLVVSGELGGTGGAKLAFFQEDTWSSSDKLGVAADQIGLFLAPLLPLLLLAAFAFSRRQVLFAALFWLPVLLVYTYFFAGGLNHYFYRYQHPVLPFIAAFAGGGAAYLIATVREQKDWAIRMLAVGVLMIAGVGIYGFYERWRNTYESAAVETLVDLEAMALDLNTIVEPDETLATHDIGAVGYFADYEVLDLVGLVNEDVLPYHDGRRVREYVDLVQPEYLLIFPDWDVFFLHLDTANQPGRYELIKTYEGGRIRSQPYLLFRVHYD